MIVLVETVFSPIVRMLECDSSGSSDDNTIYFFGFLVSVVFCSEVEVHKTKKFSIYLIHNILLRTSFAVSDLIRHQNCSTRTDLVCKSPFHILYICLYSDYFLLF